MTAYIILTALVLAAIRLFYISLGIVGLSPDEAQYWHWLMQPELSYVTKPPLTTWLIGWGTSLLGDTYLGVRFFAVIGHMFASILAFFVGREIHSDKAGLWSFIAFQVTPLLAIGGILMVSDVPALVAWLCAILCLVKIDWKKSEWQKWMMIGIAIGIAGLAKPTAAFFYPLLFIYMAWQHREWFLKPQPYVAGIISLVLQMPVLYWNALHNWVGIKHVLGQAGAGQKESSYEMWEELGEFLFGQLGVLGIVSFLAMIIFWLIGWRFNEKQKVLWVMTAPLFLFFIWKVTGAKVQANWPILATSVGLIAVSAWLPVHKRGLVRVVFVLGMGINAVLAFLLHDTFLLRNLGVNLPMKSDPSKDLRGWSVLAEDVLHELENLPQGSYVITTRYRMMAEMAFELQRLGRGDVDVIYVNSGGHRMSQYDLWAWPNLEGRTALIIRGGEGMTEVIKNGFKTCEHEKTIEVKDRGEFVRRGVLTVCEGYKGMDKIMPETH